MATDNGFGRFDNVRIPKENMLSKFAQVTEDGKYIQPPHAKLSYGGVSTVLSPFRCTSHILYVFVDALYPVRVCCSDFSVLGIDIEFD